MEIMTMRLGVVKRNCDTTRIANKTVSKVDKCWK